MTEEDRLIALLAKHHELEHALKNLEADSCTRAAQEEVLLIEKEPVGNELFSLIDRYFRRAILPVLVDEFGVEVVAKDRDTALRFSNALGDFFKKVLAKRHEPFWRPQSLQALRRWSTRVLVHQMYDLCRERTRRSRREKEHLPGLTLLFEERQRYFNKRYHTRLEDSFPLLKSWESSNDLEDVQMSQIIQDLYVTGMSKQAICDQLEIKIGKLNKLHQRAMRLLRRKEET